MNHKRLAVNIVATFVSFAVSFGISFFLSPYIIEHVGTAAYGFVYLANNFVSYASLLTIALNSMSSRFITIAVHRKDMAGANAYFNSVLISNCCMTAALILPAIFGVLFLEHLIQIPAELMLDVKILFAVIFFNFMVTLISTTFSVATFAKNRLDLESKRSIEANLLRLAVILILFLLFEPHVAYVGIASMAMALYILFTNIRLKRRLLPELQFEPAAFDWRKVREIAVSGIWNTVTRMGQLLLEGLDLLITNLFISPFMMGVLAAAKTVPNLVTNLVGTMVGVFVPNFTMEYAKGDIKSLLASVKQSMKIMGILVNLPIAGLIVFGDRFYQLWMPGQDARQLQILSVLSIAGFIISGGINCIFNIFTVTNKLKLNSILLIIIGALNAMIVVVLLKTTSLGVYAVAGVSTVINTLKNLIFVVPYGARCLGLKWYTFYGEVGKSVVSTLILCAIGFVVRLALPSGTWLMLLVSGGTMAVLGLCANLFLMLRREERKSLLQIIRRKKGEE
jgi:O-antigen/teichoic acid export membrane protein